MAIVETATGGLHAARAGATLVQLRAPRLSGRELELEAEILVDAVPVPVVVNCRVDVALAAGATGVNLPENDIPVAAARRLLGLERLVGRSVHSLAAARTAEREGADYVLFGPVYPTPSHSTGPPAGLGALTELARALRIPVLAIGGVDRARSAACLAAGAAGWAGISAFSDDPRRGER